MTAGATSNLVITEDGDYTNLQVAAADFDSVVVNAGVTASIDATSFHGDTVALDGTAAAETAAVTLVQRTAGALNLSGVTEGGNDEMASVTVTGTTG